MQLTIITVADLLLKFIVFFETTGSDRSCQKEILIFETFLRLMMVALVFQYSTLNKNVIKCSDVY